MMRLLTTFGCLLMLAHPAVATGAENDDATIIKAIDKKTFLAVLTRMKASWTHNSENDTYDVTLSAEKRANLKLMSCRSRRPSTGSLMAPAVYGCASTSIVSRVDDSEKLSFAKQIEIINWFNEKKTRGRAYIKNGSIYTRGHVHSLFGMSTKTYRSSIYGYFNDLSSMNVAVSRSLANS